MVGVPRSCELNLGELRVHAAAAAARHRLYYGQRDGQDRANSNVNRFGPCLYGIHSPAIAAGGHLLKGSDWVEISRLPRRPNVAAAPALIAMNASLRLTAMSVPIAHNRA
jgi:hypothetical protein